MSDQTVLRVELDVPVECRFSKADAFNGRPTYPLPPVTTIRGLCYAALNRPSLLNQDSKPYLPNKDTIDEEREFRQHFEDTTQVSVQPVGSPEENTQTDLRNRMKVARSDNKEQQYITYVTQEQSIIGPTYIAYINFDDSELQDTVKQALKNPERILYLGHSDDIVDISVSEHAVTECEVPENTQIYAPIENSSQVDDPILLPIQSDYKSTYSPRPAQSTLIGKQSDIAGKKVSVEDTTEYFEFF